MGEWVNSRRFHATGGAAVGGAHGDRNAPARVSGGVSAVNTHLQRARLLLERARPDLAAQELRQQIAVDPDDALAHALLAVCLMQQKQRAEALAAAERAVHLAPDFAYAHFVRAHALEDLDRLKEAEASVAEAIRLDPDDADSFALLGSIRLRQRQWRGALEAAEEGLRRDGEHVGCTNLRALALTHLGRREEAGTTIDAALARDPENALTHANQGWTLLHGGDHVRALDHFREALRLHPGLEWARQGIVEALTARNPIYRVLLRYFLWMSRLGGGARWGIVLGAFFGQRIVRETARANPDLAPFLYPILYLYLGFVFLSWTAEPLFHLLLRLDPVGRSALSREQIIASNGVGICLLGGVVGLIVGLLAGSAAALFLALASVLMTIPVAATLGRRSPGARRFLGVYTALLALDALAAGAGIALSREDLAGPLLTVFFLGWFLFQWVAVFLGGRR